jgi:hypothetical protein
VQFSIATWNVEYGLGRELNRRRRAIMADQDVDVWVLTESHDGLGPGERYVHVASRQRTRGGRIAPGSRWVSMWIRAELRPSAVPTTDPERTAACVVESALGKLLVFGTVLPWLRDSERPDFVEQLATQIPR